MTYGTDKRPEDWIILVSGCSAGDDLVKPIRRTYEGKRITHEDETWSMVRKLIS
jgi:hypothetical protein